MDRTCGNCGHSISHWTPNRCVCMRGSDSVSIRENENEACSDWDEYSSLNIEQRYQQLEHVARFMYDRMRDFCAPTYAEEAAEKLRECEVILDD